MAAARGLPLVLAAVVLAGPPAARAQQNQPIYPAYDGYVKNPDGSLTLSFAYFSHNAEPVTVPSGNNNLFAPDPGDRGQPTTFKPGHWRFQCVMVVPPDFDGKLRWTVTYAGTTTGTSERMLQSNWNLVEGARELREINYAAVPKGVCLNRAPTARILGLTGGRGAPPAMQAAVGEPVSLFGSVADEGLPRGQALRVAWTQSSGPAPAIFEDATSARTRVRFTAPGRYELELSASDSEHEARARVLVNVK